MTPGGLGGTAPHGRRSRRPEWWRADPDARNRDPQSNRVLVKSAAPIDLLIEDEYLSFQEFQMIHHLPEPEAMTLA